jgi:hypothetical protein
MASEYIKLFPLKFLLSQAQDSRKIQTLLNSFQCQKDIDIENFLKSTAIDFEKRDRSRTYIWIDVINFTVAGYFSIGLDIINLEGLSNTLKKKLNKGFAPDNNFLFTYLIGQIARSDRYNKYQLSGGKILSTALVKIKEASQIVGGKVVCLDVSNQSEKERLVNFYKNFGFKELKQINENLTRYYLILK